MPGLPEGIILSYFTNLLSFCKGCCFMVRVRVRHGFRFRPDAGRNVRLSDISHPK